MQQHIPVLLHEAIESLQLWRPTIKCIVDMTFGAGGYTKHILENFPNVEKVYGIDRDPYVAEKFAFPLEQEHPGRFKFLQGRFSQCQNLLPRTTIIDGAVFDLGVSSMQIDDSTRGFSYIRDGPLDMRMEGDQENTISAFQIVNGFSEAKLAHLLWTIGDEPYAKKIAHQICKERKSGPIASTEHLARIVSGSYSTNPDCKKHPASRTFQALRILVNEELEELREGLCASFDLLSPGGRLVVVSFHALEDEIVKSFISKQKYNNLASTNVKTACLVPKAPEIEANPRSRSAKLRVIEKL